MCNIVVYVLWEWCEGWGCVCRWVGGEGYNCSVKVLSVNIIGIDSLIECVFGIGI